MTNDQMRNCPRSTSSSFILSASRVIRHSRVVSFSVLILLLTAASTTKAQAMNMTGTWNVEIIFADGNKRALRFEAQDSGKGTLLVLDPKLKVWGPSKPSEANWTREDQNSVTFTGPVEFMLGNVGRDAGTLTFKGKFESADLITGEVEFASGISEGPLKHGTFKATRQK